MGAADGNSDEEGPEDDDDDEEGLAEGTGDEVGGGGTGSLTSGDLSLSPLRSSLEFDVAWEEDALRDNETAADGPRDAGANNDEDEDDDEDEEEYIVGAEAATESAVSAAAAFATAIEAVGPR